MSGWIKISVILLVFSTGISRAQDSGVLVKFTKAEVVVSNQEITDLTVKIRNQGSKVLTATASVVADKDLELISKHKILFSLKSGDSTYVPLKVFVTQRAQSCKAHGVRFILTDTTGNTLGSDACKVQISIKKNVLLYTQISNFLLESNTDSIRIPAKVVNMGNTPQKITLVSGYPSAIDAGDVQASMQFVLAPSKDTLVFFNKRVNRRMFTADGFDVNITGLYSNGELFNMAYVRIQNAKNNRSYHAQDYNESYENNSFTLSSQGMFSPNESYLLLGRGELELPQGKIAYNLDATSYKNSQYTQAVIRNTYLGYEGYNMGIRAGNINKNMDLNLSGKGGEFFFSDTASNNKYTVGYVNSGNNLLGDKYIGDFKEGRAAWGSFVHNGKKWQLSSDAIYELNPFLNVNNLLLTNQLKLRLKNFRYIFNFNGGQVSEYRYGDKSKFGWAAGMEMNGNIKDFNISSVNYFSTGYYPGMRQGALSFSERISYTRSGGSIWLSTDYYNYQPKRISGVVLFDPVYSSLRAEIGVSKKIFNKATLAVSPFFNSEQNNTYQFLASAGKVVSLSSWNIGTTLTVPLSAEQYVSLNMENGFYSASTDPGMQFHSKSNLNYRYKFFNLNATLQSGSFYIGEVINSNASNVKGNYIVNITPFVQRNFMRNRLRMELGLNYSNTKFSGKGLQVTGRTEYEVLPKTVLFAAANHNRYTFINGQYNSSILEVGITKKLRNTKVGAKNETMQVFIFKDINQNGTYDQGDSISVNHLLYINDVIFTTKADGTVTYKNLPAGEYNISMPKVKDWYAPEQRINFKGKQRIEIPLQKTGTLKGSISYSFQEFSYEIGQQKEGLLVVATSDNGQVYVTRTNVEGKYIFYIPVGKYAISMNMEGLSGEVECKNNGIITELTASTPQKVDLILNVKQRKVETKRFVSPTLKK
ncbi:hypothetical protein [Pedobacter frigoris]|uniref:SD-repeat containing protein B domain-containing protein n=1 Tax=Pedobacter frigoris TaxID=2571272 RepID=A0A4U1CSD3_9SPHI|nr:hypothetical protein [Pedobacter frigoris]TKC08638.1 hypothetical protein FA047_00625 [Pedobacter frigoris]